MKRWLVMMMCAVWFLKGNLSFAITSPLGMGSSPAWGSGMPALESFDDDDDYWDDDRW